MISINLLKKVVPEILEEKLEKLSELENVFKEENKKVNLVSRKDIDFLFEHHILHSLVICKLFDFKNIRTVVDVGTGGGFPGLPISIFFDDISFTLLDSKRKKINSIGNIINKLSIKNVSLVCDRVENIESKFDIVLGRGVCCVDRFYKITSHLLNDTGKIIYLNGVNDKIIVDKNIKVKYFNINEILDIDFYSEKQVVLIEKLKL